MSQLLLSELLLLLLLLLAAAATTVVRAAKVPPDAPAYQDEWGRIRPETPANGESEQLKKK